MYVLYDGFGCFGRGRQAWARCVRAYARLQRSEEVTILEYTEVNRIPQAERRVVIHDDLRATDVIQDLVAKLRAEEAERVIVVATSADVPGRIPIIGAVTCGLDPATVVRSFD